MKKNTVLLHLDKLHITDASAVQDFCLQGDFY